MLSKNFLIKKELFIYSKYVFQIRSCFIHDTNKKGTTMFSRLQDPRKESVQKTVKSFKSTLQDRLFLIRQSVTSKSAIAEKSIKLTENKEVKKDIFKNQNELRANELSLTSNSITNGSMLPTTVVSKSYALPERKHTSQDRSKNVLKPSSYIDLTGNEVVEIKSDSMSNAPDTSLKNFNLKLKFIEAKMEELTLNETIDTTNLIQKTIESNDTKLDSLSIYDGEDHSNIVLSTNDLRKYLDQKRINSYGTRLESLKNFIGSDTTILAEREALNRKRSISYKTRLKCLKIFNRESDSDILRSSFPHISHGIFDRQTGCASSVNRVILTAKRCLCSNSEEVKLIEEKSSYPDNRDLNFLKDNKLNTLDDRNCKSSKSIVDNKLSNVTTEQSASKDIKVTSIYEKFPFPKSTLHNYYQVLSDQQKDKSLKIEPVYKRVKIMNTVQWDCMYHLKWPENVHISAQGPSKKGASHFAALKCLALLSEHKKIAKDGLPSIYTTEDVKKLTNKKQTELKFNENVMNKMQSIVDIFNNNLESVISKVDYDEYKKHQLNNIINREDDTVNFHLLKAPIYLGMPQYFSREKVELPISKLKESFIDLIQNNNCVIVKGEPGCGKSTRVPQYVLESWVRGASPKDELCRIAVTQPRRIAAVSLAERVALERDEELGRIVGYQVRLKSDFQAKTGRILYCTTGILLRHLQSDPNLTKFSHVILDEAHERDVNTDLLMNLLKKAIKENNDLKVVVMSATIDAEAFSEYFEGAPIFNVPGFTYPVKKNFLDNCQMDVSKTLKMCLEEHPRVIHEDVAEVLGYIHKNKPEGAILTFLPGWEDLVKVEKLIPRRSDLVVYLVHSKLKDSEQYRIFSRPPPGVRKIVLATNIAETSITIDDVVYVVDTGIHKDQIFDNDKGINVLDLGWISKASANQRAGRAGRCSPGESYHLYSQERFSKFPDYSSPKILNSSLTKVVLDSKVFANNMDACDFMNSLLTPPEKIAVERAVNELKQLELLDDDEKLTPLGRTLVNFQLEPNLAKAMVNSVVFKCTTPIVDIVTLFSSDAGIFGSVLTEKDHIKSIKSQYCKSSDHLALMRVYEKWIELYEEGGDYAAKKFCGNTNLVPHKLEFVNKLQDVHFGYLYDGLYKSMPMSNDFSDNDELVKAVLYSGTGTILEHRNWDIVKNRLKANVNVLVTRNNHKATISSESVNYKRQKFPSNFLVYINETRSNVRRTTVVRECSLISALSVLLFSNKELEISKIDPANSTVISDNMVIIGIKNTKVQFLCDMTQAEALINCKRAIEASYRYLIHQLTYAGEDIPEFLEYWDSILKNLGDVLEESGIE